MTDISGAFAVGTTVSAASGIAPPPTSPGESHRPRPSSEEWFEHACLRLIVGDNHGYRSFVREMRRSAGQTSDPFVAYVLARSCVQVAERR